VTKPNAVPAAALLPFALAVFGAALGSAPGNATGAPAAPPPTPEDRAGAFTADLHLGPYLFGFGLVGKDQNLSTGPMIGVRAGYHVMPRLRLELDLSEVLTYVKAASLGSHADEFVAVSPIYLQARYDLVAEGSFVGFATGGLGTVWFFPSDRASDARFALRWGVGAEYFVFGWLGARVDIAQSFFTGASPFVDHDANGTFNLQFTVGADVLVGARPKQKSKETP